MKYVISVGKAYKHRGKREHKSKTRKHYFVYFYDEHGNFHSEPCNFLQAMYYKTKKVYPKQFFCNECDYQFVTFLKDKAQEEIECPNCSIN